MHITIISVASFTGAWIETRKPPKYLNKVKVALVKDATVEQLTAFNAAIVSTHAPVKDATTEKYVGDDGKEFQPTHP